jgi:transcriptional regulator with XRE-family HTH domain
MQSQTMERPVPGIGDRVKAARSRCRWSREELAFRAGISWPAIAQIESGRRTHLRPGTLSALAEALGVTIDYLVNGGPTDTPMLTHAALVYRDGDEFAGTVQPFTAEGVERSEAVMVVTTPANIESVRGGLGRDARRVEFVDSAAWYGTPAATLLAYREFASAKLEAGAPWVRVVGEPVWTGRTTAEARLWARYESLINLAFASWPVTVLCPYDRRCLRPAIIRQAHATHPEILSDGVAESSPDYVSADGFMLESGS